MQTDVEAPSYLSKAAGLMTGAELAHVVNTLAKDPESGVLIKGTKGLRKARIALAGRGKSGGARVIYWFHSDRYPVVLQWVFAKNAAANLTASQAIALTKLGEGLIKSIGIQP